MSDPRLAAIVEIARRLAVERDPDRLVAEVCHAAQEITLAGGAQVEVVAVEGLPIRRATRGVAPATLENPAALLKAAAVLDRVTSQRLTLRVQNPSGTPEAMGFDAGWGATFSYLAVPIAVSAKVLGWIAVRNKIGAAGFSESDEQALLILAVQAAIALENAHLVEVLSRQAPEMRESEQRTLQSQKMEAVGLLAGGIAHDFNNLLVAILGYAEFLRQSVPSEEHRRDLDQILEAGHRAASLTAQLLAFSRQQVLQPRVIEVNTLVTAICSMLGRVIGEHITLVTHLAGDVPTIRADQGQIEQVLMNLAVNARDAMPSGGTLSVETAAVDIDIDAERPGVSGRFVRIAVRDTGAGMSEETRHRVFEPFFTTKEKGKGTGLGLATAYGIITQSGGWINVASEPGRGTTFEVLLPAAQAAPDERAATAAPRPAPRGTETILVVEDEPAVRNLVQTVLSNAGYRVVAAKDPEEARTLFTEQPVALVFTDVVMPGGNGIDLYRELAAVQPGLRVLYTSGYADNLFVDAAALSGANYVPKPFMPAVIVSKIREVLDR